MKYEKKLLVILTAVLFIINAFKFLNNSESSIFIISLLFNLIIYLGIIIIIIIFHNNEINFEELFKNNFDKNSDNDNSK